MYLADSPIKSSSEDKLDRVDFVNRISQTIIEWKAKESLVIAIYGPWGYGKSSILNLLKEEISKNQAKSVEVTTFDPWFFNSLENILEAFLELFSTLGTKLLKDEKEKSLLIRSIQKYGKKLSFSIAPEISVGLFKFKIPVSDISESESIDKIKNELQSSLAKIEGRLVVLIDNLDRLDIKELLLMLKLVRLCNDFPNITYVLAFDRKQVERLLTEEKQIDPDYLEKIIQVDITLPKIEDAQIDNFINESLNKIFNEYEIILEENFQERFVPLFQNHIKLILNNFRAAKRYVNALSFSLPLMKDEVNYADFFSLEFLRVFFPRVYAELQNYGSAFLEFLPIGLGNDYKQKQLSNTYKNLQTWIDKNYSDNSMIIIQVIGMLFPTFNAYISNPQNPGYYVDRNQLDKELRISSSQHYEKYFRFQIPSKEISNAFMKSFVILLDAQLDEAKAKEILKYLIKFQGENKLIRFCRKLRFEVENLSALGIENLLNIFASITDILKWEPIGLFEPSEVGIVTFLILDALFTITNTEHFLEYFTKFITDCVSLTFAADISTQLLVSLDKGNYRLEDNIEKEKLVAPIINRVREEVINSKMDILEEYPKSFSKILAIWMRPEFMGKPDDAYRYLYDLIEIIPQHLVKILANFVWTYAGTDKPSGFDYKVLKERYDVANLYSIAKSVSVDGISEIELYALQEFMKYFEQDEQNA